MVKYGKKYCIPFYYFLVNDTTIYIFPPKKVPLVGFWRIWGKGFFYVHVPLHMHKVQAFYSIMTNDNFQGLVDLIFIYVQPWQID